MISVKVSCLGTSHGEHHNNSFAGEIDAVALETITKAQMLGVYKKYLSQTGPFRRTLAVHMISRRLEAVLPLPEGTIEIVDVHTFKAGLDSTPGAAPVVPHVSGVPDSRM